MHALYGNTLTAPIRLPQAQRSSFSGVQSHVGNIVLMAVAVITIVSVLVIGADATIRLAYSHVLDLKEQTYADISAPSITDHGLLQYRSDPLRTPSNPSADATLSVSRYVPVITGESLPSRAAIFALTEWEDELGQNRNHIKRIRISYNALSTNQNEDLTVYLVRWDPSTPTNVSTGKLLLGRGSNLCDGAGCIPSGTTIAYQNQYILTDSLASSNLDTKHYDYALYLASQNGVSYALSAIDGSGADVPIPSRYVDARYQTVSDLSRSTSQVTDSRVDTYPIYHANLLSSTLYNTP